MNFHRVAQSLHGGCARGLAKSIRIMFGGIILVANLNVLITVRESVRGKKIVDGRGLQNHV